MACLLAALLCRPGCGHAEHNLGVRRCQQGCSLRQPAWQLFTCCARRQSGWAGAQPSAAPPRERCDRACRCRLDGAPCAGGPCAKESAYECVPSPAPALPRHECCSTAGCPCARRWTLGDDFVYECVPSKEALLEDLAGNSSDPLNCSLASMGLEVSSANLQVQWEPSIRAAGGPSDARVALGRWCLLPGQPGGAGGQGGGGWAGTHCVAAGARLTSLFPLQEMP